VCFDHPLLLAAAFIVLCGAVQDHVRSESRGFAEEMQINDVMIPAVKLEVFTHGTTVSRAVSKALSSLQPFFPVMVMGQPTGIVYREDLMRHGGSGSDDYIATVTSTGIPTVSPETSLSEVLATMDESGSPVVFVVDESAGTEQTFRGLLTQDLLGERILIAALRESRTNDDDTEWSIQP